MSDWRERGEGACTGYDADLWFAAERSYDAEIAAGICYGECLVRDVCLTHALEHGERHGIWGGLSARERERLRRRRLPLVHDQDKFATASSTTTDDRGESHDRTGAGRPEDPQGP